MPIITSSPAVAANDPQVRAAVQAVLRTFQLSAEKATLHHADPERFPVEKNVKSFETILAPLLNSLPPERQQALKSKALASAAAPAAQRAKTYGSFSKVDFSSPIPVAEQLHGSARVKPVVSAMRRLIDEDGDWPPRGDHDGWPPEHEDGPKDEQPLKRFVLSLHSIKAVKDTPEIFKDEIYLGATAVGITTSGGKPVTSKELKVDPFNLGSFKKGQTRSLNDKTLYAFYPPKPEEYPAAFVVTLLLLEKDFGKKESIRKVLKNIEDEVAKEITKWAKKFDGLFGDLVQLVAKFLPPLLAKIFDYIAGLLGDDLFTPHTISVSAPSPESRLPGKNTTPLETVSLLMDGGSKGRYDLKYSWHIFA
jgi:hypothetical protein